MENAPETLRGELTRWLLETKAGVFAGNVSALVRDKLWDKVIERQECGGALLLYNAATEQGFEFKLHGNPRRTVIDLEGVQLIKVQC
jgi:CRISPR-associated protein Cas2